MQNFPTVGSTAKIFPCIVCSLETNSVDELHHHQKYSHTTDELSLSLICLVHYMCLKNEALGLDFAAKYPLLLKNHLANYHFCQLDNQRNINSSNYCATLDPSLYYYDCGETNKDKKLSGKTRMAKSVEQAESQASHYSLISVGDFKDRDRLLADAKNMMSAKNFNTIFLSNWEIELGKVSEISDETFLKCVDEICKDLQVVTKRHGFWNSINQKNRGRKVWGKRTTRSEKFVRPIRQVRTKGLQRSQTCAESPHSSDKSKENFAYKCKGSETTPIDYSTKLASFSQSFHQFLNKNDKALSGESVENPNSQAILCKRIPVLEKSLGDSNCEQPLRDMPVLESNLGLDGLSQQ